MPATPSERPEFAPFDDPVNRVHHHNWHPTAGNVERGFCGATVIALDPGTASNLPCCPMCDLILNDRGWNCIARENH